ncbi:MAG: glutamate--cysteine ligase [Deltaproteobacteria bacterium]|nr:glutamate--cysteine ligase [Deltaproteobacteria bacterium]
MTFAHFFEVVKNRGEEVEEWLKSEWKGLTPHFYLSCDIRHSDHKIGVVDTNLFPSGFNNLCPSFSRQTSQAFKDYLDRYHPGSKKILIFAEEHTRNKFYLLNLLQLKSLLEAAGRKVAVGMKGDFMREPVLNVNLDDKELLLYQIRKAGNRLVAQDFDPDLILLNNDLSAGLPDWLSTVSQPIIPSVNMGWHRRRKNRHFGELEKLLADFGKRFLLDPWLFSPLTDWAHDVDIESESTLYPMAEKVEVLLARIKVKYAEYRIEETPYVYVKSNVGTYGLGLLPVFSGEEILSLNRKKRGKLSASKGNLKISEYLIQEGIPTKDYYSGYPIEPVIYVSGKKDVGGFFRIHESKNELESLNAPGATYSCLCLHKLTEPHEEFFLDCSQKENVVLLARFLSRIAAIAAAKETALIFHAGFR